MQPLSPPAVACADTEATPADWHRYSFGFRPVIIPCCGTPRITGRWLSVISVTRRDELVASHRSAAGLRRSKLARGTGDGDRGR